MNLSPSISPKMSRSSRDSQEDHFAMGQMNWLLNGSDSVARPSTASSLHSYGSTSYQSPSERLRSRSSFVKSVDHSIEVPPVRPTDILSQSINSSTEHIFGLYGIEIWEFNADTGKLHNVPVSQSGIHIKRIPQEADQNSLSYSPEARWSLDRLTQQSRLDYLAPKPLESGVSLAGALWSASASTGTLHAMVHKRFGLLAGLQQVESVKATEAVLWREVDELATDPNQVRVSLPFLSVIQKTNCVPPLHKAI